MIIDKLENIIFYSQLPKDVVKFITNLHQDIELGRHDLGNGNFAVIEEYNTKNIDNAIYESHDKYADIQILLREKENIYYSNVEDLIVSVPYDENRDIKFYGNKVDQNKFITLDSTNFVVLYPHEAHAPQIICENCCKIKKVVVKFKIK